MKMTPSFKLKTVCTLTTLGLIVLSGGFPGLVQAHSQPLVLVQADAETFLTEGVQKFEQRDYEAAIAAFTEAIRLNPNYSLAYYNRGTSLRRLGKTEQAVTDYTKAIEVNQEWGDKGPAIAYNNRGNALADLGDNKRAMADYNQAIKLNPSYGLAYYNRGITHGALGNPRQALEDYSKAVQYRPDLPEAYLNRAVTYVELGNKKNAIADYQKAAALYQKQGRNKEYQDMMSRIRRLQ